MKLIEILKIRKYGIISLASAVAMLLVYPYLQVALNGGIYNYFFWFEVIVSESVLNLILYVIFSALFGMVVGLNAYNWKNRTCSLKGSAGTSGLGGMLAIFTSQCSACLSLASLVLPTVAVGALTLYNTAFNFLSISILVIAIYLLGGFRKE